MSELELTCADDRLTLRLNNAWPELAPAADGDYCLRFYSAEKDTVQLRLDAATLEELGRACLPHLRPLVPERTTPEAEAPFREPAYFLKELEDSLIRMILREMPSDTLIFFLWYMKDEELIRKVMNNCSERAARMLMEDLFARHGDSGDPDHALKYLAECGRETVREVMALVMCLAEESRAILDKEGD